VLAPESEGIGKAIRQPLYDNSGGGYLILFAVMRDEKAVEVVVRVFRIWHGARARVDASEIGKGESQEYTPVAMPSLGLA
jgi:hypothetical protein